MIHRWLVALAERYPISAGFIFGLIGLVLIVVAFKEGPRLAEFEGGRRVVGEVVTAGSDFRREPPFAADVKWTSDGKLPWETTSHRAVVAVLRRQLPDPKAADPERRLRPGSALPLVISTKNADVAMSVEAFEDEHVLKLAGVRALTIPFVIGLCFFAGAAERVVEGLRRRATPAGSPPRRAQPAQTRPLGR